MWSANQWITARSEKFSGLHNGQSPATTLSLVPDSQLRSVSRCELSSPEIDHPTPRSVRNGQPFSESTDTEVSCPGTGQATSSSFPDCQICSKRIRRCRTIRWRQSSSNAQLSSKRSADQRIKRHRKVWPWQRWINNNGSFIQPANAVTSHQQNRTWSPYLTQTLTSFQFLIHSFTWQKVVVLPEKDAKLDTL